MADITEAEFKKLLTLGYQYSPEATKATSVVERNQAMVFEWQKFHCQDLAVAVPKYHGRQFMLDGAIGPATSSSIARLRCAFPDFREPGQPHKLAAVEQGNWPSGCRMALTWDSNIQSLKGLTSEEITLYQKTAFDNWRQALMVDFEHRPGEYPNVNFAEKAANLGNGGVLADHYLAYNDCGGTVVGRMNTAISWAFNYALTTFTHEVGHGLGFEHVPQDNTALMYPSINRASQERKGRPGPSDIAEAKRRGYQVRTTPVPPDNPPVPDPPSTPPVFYGQLNSTVAAGTYEFVNADGTRAGVAIFANGKWSVVQV